MGKILVIAIVACALIAGGAMYYLQVYAYYEEVVPNGTHDVVLTPKGGAGPEAILYDDFQGIDAESSPIRYRACFTTPVTLDEVASHYAPYENAQPLEAPGWFDCFDASDIGAMLEDGRAEAFLSEKDHSYGIDRIVAVTEDGRGYVWHQINRCGEIVFDGQPAPADCPTPPAGG